MHFQVRCYRTPNLWAFTKALPASSVRPLGGDGAGQADFLAAIGEVGSIAGAGRAMGLSYKKTRHLIDELNRACAAERNRKPA